MTNARKTSQDVEQLIAPQVAIPIHYNDYEVFKSPLEDFKAAVIKAGLQSQVKYLNHGDIYTFEVAVTQ